MNKHRLSKNTTIIFFGIILAILFLPQVSLAATYYADGNLISDCTSFNYSIANRDCNGLDGNAYNTIQEAVNVVTTVGDIVNVRSGIYAEAISLLIQVKMA